MHNFFNRWSPAQLLIALNGGLVVCYIALIAFVMAYAALEVQFADSVRTDETALGTLETNYLNQLGSITNADYAAEGYSAPVAELFVPAAPEAAINIR